VLNGPSAEKGNVRLRVATAITLFALAANAFASSPCIAQSPEKTLSESTLAVVGEVISVTPADINGVAAAAEKAVRGLYRVRVVEEFKGGARAEYALIGELARPRLPPGQVYVEEAGFVPEVGKKYVLFGWGTPLKLSGCGSVPYSQAKSLIEALRKQKKGRGIGE